MAFSVNTPVGDGVTKQFAVNFTNGLFSRDSVHVFVEGEVDGLGDPIERTFTFINDGLIELDGAAPAAGLTVEIRRIMDKDEPAVDFEDGEILTEATADRGLDHLLNSIHELLDGYGFASLRTSINLNGNKLLNVGDGTEGTDGINRDQAIALLDATSTGSVSRRRETRKIASADQTVFNLADVTYVVGINNIQVYVNGVAQVSGIDYLETDSSTITFTSGLDAGDYVDMYVNEITGSTFDPVARDDIGELQIAVDQRTIYVGSVAELEALPSPVENQEAVVSGTPFKYDGTDWQLSGGFVYVESFGASPDNADNTDAYNALIASVPSGTSVVWGSPGATYTGNFVSPTKALRCNLNGATLTDFTNDPICAIGSLTNVVEYSVNNGSVGYGRRDFEVTGADTLFSAGDIGYLWDQAIRPTGGDVNFETVKIKSITGDVITIEGFLASFKGASAIKFYHDPKQLKGSEIKNGKIAGSATHTDFGAACFNSESPVITGIETENMSGNAVAMRYCYDATVGSIRPKNPRETTSGRGYGVALIGTSKYEVRDIIGESCRHAFLQDSCYFGEIDTIKDFTSISSPVSLSHNGFGGHLTLNNVDAATSSYAVNLAAQGYGGVPSADKGNHPFRNIEINNVRNNVPSKDVNDSNVAGVYFQNNIIDCRVDGVEVEYENATALASGAQSYIVRLNGISLGKCKFSGLSANRIGAGVYIDDDGTVSFARNNLEINGIALGESDYFVRGRGRVHLSCDNFVAEVSPISGKCVYLQSVAAGSPVACYIGRAIDMNSSSVITLDSTDSGIDGCLPMSGKGSPASVTVVAGGSVTRADVQNKSAFLRLLSPVGVGTTTLSATDALPAAITQNEEIILSQPSSSRDAVEFPAGNNILSTFTVGQERVVRLIAENGKWRYAGSHSAT